MEDIAMKQLLNRLMQWANLKGIGISMGLFLVSVITINGKIIGVEAMKRGK